MKKYEEMSVVIENNKSLRKVKRLKDKPGEKVQVSITKFLQGMEKDEGQNAKASRGLQILSQGAKRPSQLMTKGARTKPKLAVRKSSPVVGPSIKEGGTLTEGGKKEGKRVFGPLERWLLPLGKSVGPSRTDSHGQEDHE